MFMVIVDGAFDDYVGQGYTLWSCTARIHEGEDFESIRHHYDSPDLWGTFNTMEEAAPIFAEAQARCADLNNRTRDDHFTNNTN